MTTVCVCVQVRCVYVYLDKSGMRYSARRCRPAARQNYWGQGKSLVWGHPYTQRRQAAPCWAHVQSNPSLLNHPPRYEVTDSLSYLVLVCILAQVCGTKLKVYCTHYNVFTTENVEASFVPRNIGASVSENKNDSVRLSHQLDCVLQSKFKGLACVCGLSQPGHVFDCPAHTHRHTLINVTCSFKTCKNIMQFGLVNSEITNLQSSYCSIYYSLQHRTELD